MSIWKVFSNKSRNILNTKFKRKMTSMKEKKFNINLLTILPLFFIILLALILIPWSTDNTVRGLYQNTDLQYADNSFDGELTNDWSAFCISAAGDVNNDSHPDFIIGAHQSDIGCSSPNYGTGGAYLILGRSDNNNWDEPFDLGDANATFFGEKHNSTFFSTHGDLAGFSVSGAGDVDGDDYDDFLISSYFNPEAGWNHAGQIYLMYGRSDVSSWTNPMNLSNADASFWGEDGGDYAGMYVTDAGDVNGDDYDDFLISAPSKGEPLSTVYLILGKQGRYNSDTSLSNANKTFIAEDVPDSLGKSMAGLGDVNGDGYDDFLLGAPFSNVTATNEGRAYLILGRSDIETLNGSNPLYMEYANATFVGPNSGDSAGMSVAGAGDFNNDGYADFLILAPGNDTIYLMYGRSGINGWDYPLSLSNANLTIETEVPNQFTTGWPQQTKSLAGVGDVNNDKFDDILIGAPFNDENAINAGKVYLVLGNTSTHFGTTLNLVNANASFWGEAEDDMAGWCVSALGLNCSSNVPAYNGDMNNDGYDDFLIGAPYGFGQGSSSGVTYLILGDDIGWDTPYPEFVSLLPVFLGISIIIGVIIFRCRNQKN